MPSGLNPGRRQASNAPALQAAIVSKGKGSQMGVHAHILDRRDGRVYVHYANTDKRMDEWVSESLVQEMDERSSTPGSTGVLETRKRKADYDLGTPMLPDSPAEQATPGPDSAFTSSSWKESGLTEEEFDIQQHKGIMQTRNFDKVLFGDFSVKTWYYSPYPKGDGEPDEPIVPSHKLYDPSVMPTRITGVNRATSRSHGRTSDLFAGGMGRTFKAGETPTLFVCDRCFKYMTDGRTWDSHMKACKILQPPGRIVYERGGHAIWEVDGAKHTMYCQNLALFGKLFIDIKTLFFDLENFLFYLVTESDSQRRYFVLGFFSKEKVSYDNYNVACITTFPPFQRKAFGMLMIEFSYELSKRLGKNGGTPERPLSDLGLRSYLAYWVATLVRFFRRVLAVIPVETETESTGFLLHPSPEQRLRSPSEKPEDNLPKAKKKRSKAAEIESYAIAPTSVLDDPTVAKARRIIQVSNPDGSATSHVVIEWTLADLALATNLALEDTKFALNECGLMQTQYSSTGGEESVILITRDQVEKVAVERKVKKACIDLAHLRLDDICPE